MKQRVLGDRRRATGVVLGIVLGTLALQATAETWVPSDEVGGSWYAMASFARMTDNRLHEVARFHRLSFDAAKLYSVELGYRLHDDHPLVKLVEPLVSSVNVGVNVTYQDDPVGDIYQANPFIMFRWSQFPWNSTVRTSVAIAEGLSYSSRVPATELDPGRPNRNYERLVNYLGAEVTFSMPSRKDWELVYRLHHRSGIFGLLDADNRGSTAMGIGIRHYFK